MRLDRALVSLDWEEMYRDCHLQALSSEASDHCPLLLQTNMSLHAKPRFHFELYWSKTLGYQEALITGWKCAPNITDPLRRLDAMLRNLKRELQSWASTRIGNVREQLLMARDVIFKLDRAAERRELSDGEFELCKALKIKCLGLSSLERTIARQRSRVRYLADGDANTKYFHLLARGRKRRNGIRRLRDGNGTMCASQAEMEAAIHAHFSSVFGQPGPGGFTVDYYTLGIPSRSTLPR